MLASFGVVLLEAMASRDADRLRRQRRLPPGHPRRRARPLRAARTTARRWRPASAALLDDAGLRREWGERGRRVAVERYSWPEIARRVEGVYLEILASKGGRPEARPPLGVRYNLRRNPIELVRNVPAALRAGYPKEDVEH